MNTTGQREELRVIFRQIAQTLEGVFGIYDADEDLLWAISRGLDQIFEEHLSPPEQPIDADARRARMRKHPHPAFIELLATIDRGAPDKADS